MEETEVSETADQDPGAAEERDAVQEPVDETPGGAVDEAADGVGKEASEEKKGSDALADEDLPRAIEAVLFCAGEPVTIRELAELFKFGVHDVRSAVEKLREDYIDSGRAFRVEDISGGVQLLTLSEFDPWLRSLFQKRRSSRLSPAALETLAIVAYKGPITKAELESIRGVQCAPTLNTLLDRELIRVAGKAPGLGRPLLYHTTPLFLESFGLGSLKDLPEPEAPPSREERAAAQDASEEELEIPGVSPETAGDEDVSQDAAEDEPVSTQTVEPEISLQDEEPGHPGT